MAVVDARVSVWEALAGRAPGQPVGPADPGLWAAVAERINPAKARPVLRAGIETAELVSARGVPYVMLRSPDRDSCYLRLTPEEVELTRLMDGSRTLARLVADFARISGRLAPDQVRRVVADLAGNRMLEELPVDAFAPLRRVRGRAPWPLRLGKGILAVVQGRRVALANIDPVIGLLYRAGGRLLFTRVAAALMVAVATLGLAAFCYQWWSGAQSVFLTANSYVTGAAVLLGLNVLALACHELGHALATKHAGRRVPRAGFLIYFGIPSVFVDTTDVWMAGRRARLLTTAAGPTAGLVLAGASALVGFAQPALAPICFKLSFAWYLNALFNLNPFLALDGYYLVMDWLEIPNLRARGLAWVAARVRRRPPSWSGLDREGRLVALYGVLALGWLAIAVNLAYRLYVDRIGGLIVGLWRSGPAAQVLLVLLVLGLASPVVYILMSFVSGRVRRWRRRLGERRVDRDEPRRLAALRDSTLRDLPEPALRTLAAAARWRYPRTGEQVVLAGAAQPYVFAVVDGALEARAPGDPPGSVRERVGAGGVVGLAPAVTGAPSALAWHTAGTTLLAIPTATVAATVGPVVASAGAGFGTTAEADQLFAEAPGLAALSTEDRLGLAAVAVPVSLAPGAPVTLASGDSAVIIASGVVVTPDGHELGRGTMIGPVGEEYVGPVATVRSPVRLFSIPAVSGLPLLLGASAGMLATELHGRGPGRAPVSGVHPPAAYPPLAAPPGPPISTVDDSTDRRFERRMRWLLVLVLLLVLLCTGGNVALANKVWAEMPTDVAHLLVGNGTASIVVDGRGYELASGDEIYVGEQDTVTVGPRSWARLTFRGGGSALLCAGVHLRLGPLSSSTPVAREPVSPTGAFELTRGRTIVDTTTASPAFTDLSLSVVAGNRTLHNSGAAWFAATPGSTTVSQGEVFSGGTRLPATGATLTCGADTLGQPPVLTPSGATTPSPTPTPTGTPTSTPSGGVTATPTASASTTTPSATPSTAADPGPPSIRWRVDPNRTTVAQVIGGLPCTDNPTSVSLTVADLHFGVPRQAVKYVNFSWTWPAPTWSHNQQAGGPDWSDATPVIPYSPNTARGGEITIEVTAYDADGQPSSTLQSTINVAPCLDTTPPKGSLTAKPLVIHQVGCTPASTTVTLTAQDNSGQAVILEGGEYTVPFPGPGRQPLNFKQVGANVWQATIGPFQLNENVPITGFARVRDAAGNRADIGFSAPVQYVLGCVIG